MLASAPLARGRAIGVAGAVAVGDSGMGSGDDTSLEESFVRVDCRDVDADADADVVVVGDPGRRAEGALSDMREGASVGEGRACITPERSLFVRTAADLIIVT